MKGIEPLDLDQEIKYLDKPLNNALIFVKILLTLLYNMVDSVIVKMILPMLQNTKLLHVINLEEHGVISSTRN